MGDSIRKLGKATPKATLISQIRRTGIQGLQSIQSLSKNIFENAIDSAIQVSWCVKMANGAKAGINGGQKLH